MKKKVFITSLILILIDRIIKFLIVNNLVLNKPLLVIKNFFYLTYAKNDGSAWSILSGQIILIIAVTLIALFLLYKMLSKEEKITTYKYIYYSMIFGGVISNLIDRVVFHHVIDYLDFIIFKYDFPIFNFSDSLIVVGAFLLIVDIIRSEKNEKNSD